MICSLSLSILKDQIGKKPRLIEMNKRLIHSSIKVRDGTRDFKRIKSKKAYKEMT